MNTQSNPRAAGLHPGALRAAEIITGVPADSTVRFATEYGSKTVIGIAAIIQRHTGCNSHAALVVALERIHRAAAHASIPSKFRPKGRKAGLSQKELIQLIEEQARAALSSAK